MNDCRPALRRGEFARCRYRWDGHLATLLHVTTIIGLVALLTGMFLTAEARVTAAAGMRFERESGPLNPTVKRIYIANDDHTDYFWKGDGDQYRAAFLDMLDYYMTQAESTASNPEDARGCFNCDGSFWVWEYEHNKTPAEFDRLIGHLAAGTITMPLNTLVLLYGAMPAEAVIRNMYYAGRLERRFGLSFPLVVPQENQTLPGGVASLWAGSGAQYAWKGICNCATQTNAAIRPREIYHFEGRDGASLCMKWNSMRGSNRGVGGYAEARHPSAVVEYLDSDPVFLAAWPWAASAAFGYGWDDLQTMTDVFIDASLALSDSSRRVIVSNEIDFFEDFLVEFGGDIPTFSGSFGNDWDLLTATLGEVAAGFRRSVEKLRAAEAMATVVSLQDATFMNGREEERDRAFNACGLFYEHAWTADGVIPKSVRKQYQLDQLAEFTGYVDQLHDDALTALGGLVAQPPGLERHVVFNPLSWTRTDFADLVFLSPQPVHVVDVTTDEEVPSQVMMVSGETVVRVLARDVPPVGYRVYEVRQGTGSSFPNSATVDLPSFDNGTYEVSLGVAGNIVSLIDHMAADRQLVDASGGGSIHDIGSGDGTVSLESQGPVSTTLRVIASGTPAHEVAVTLFRSEINRISIESRVTENFGGFGNAVGYRSTFDLADAVMHHEEVGMIARVARAANGGDYADENTRIDYLTLNHFVDLSEVDYGVTMSSWDSQFFQAGNSTINTLDDSTPSIRAMVGMQLIHPSLGFPDQGGFSEFLNRYALRTHTESFAASAAMRFAMAHQNPLVTTLIYSGPGGPLSPDQHSGVVIDDDDLLLWALKPAEEGIQEGGVIARVWNLASDTRGLNLSLPGTTINAAVHTTHIETDVEAGTVIANVLVDNLGREEMKTYRLFATATGIPDQPVQSPVARFRVHPNPSSSTGGTAISYAIGGPARVRIKVHDVNGRLVRIVADAVQAPGEYSIVWRGDDESGTPTGSGVYWIGLWLDDALYTRQVVRLR